MMIWFASSTGSNCFIPVPNRLPIPAAMISNVVFISVVLSCLKTYHMFINSLESLSSLNGVRPQYIYMEQTGICAGSGQTSDQTILEHIRATAGILANDDAGRLIVAIALAQCIVAPAEEATHLVGMVSGQINTSFTTEAISSKILSHFCLPHSQK